jgi:hypothetical protein
VKTMKLSKMPLRDIVVKSAIIAALVALSGCAANVAETEAKPKEVKDAPIERSDDPICRLQDDVSILKVAVAKLISRNASGGGGGGGGRSNADLSANKELIAALEKALAGGGALSGDSWLNDPDIRKNGRFIITVKDASGTSKALAAPVAPLLNALDELGRRLSVLEADRAELLKTAGVTDGNTTKAIIALARTYGGADRVSIGGSGSHAAVTPPKTPIGGINGNGGGSGAPTSGVNGTSANGTSANGNGTGYGKTAITPIGNANAVVAGTPGGNSNVGGLRIALGDKACSLDSPMCYVAVAGVNVRRTPCSDNRLSECKAMRVRTYGETLLPVDLKAGTKNPNKSYFMINRDEWVIAYSLRELDPKSPPITFTADKDVEVIGGVMFNLKPGGDQLAFKGEKIGVVPRGETIYVSGCALGWCKLYGSLGYVLHADLGAQKK